MSRVNMKSRAVICPDDALVLPQLRMSRLQLQKQNLILSLGTCDNLFGLTNFQLKRARVIGGHSVKTCSLFLSARLQSLEEFLEAQTLFLFFHEAAVKSLDRLTLFRIVYFPRIAK